MANRMLVVVVAAAVLPALRADAAPTVTILEPSSAAILYGLVTVFGTSSGAVAAVSVAVDGGAFGRASGTSSWSYALDTTALADGAHALAVKAVDSSGSAASAFLSVSVSNPRVQVAQGALRGYPSGRSHLFKNIPYAAPPVGKLRWKAPAPPASWSGVRDATQWPPYCVQTNKYMDITAPIVGTEDCLYLNVFKPLDGAGPLPVMVWIHGGGGQWGASSLCNDALANCIYDGRRLAESGPVIVVTINYRVGPFGYLAHPALSAESTYNGSGNYGHMDQLAALQWVKQNIAAFGGDPSKVTVFGESHGGNSVETLMASPLGKGLFQRAIIQSGDPKAVALSTLESSGQQLAAAVGCASAAAPAACLRSVGAYALIDKYREGLTNNSYKTGQDGYVLLSPIMLAFQRHQETDVPFMIGDNADEAVTLLEPHITADFPSTWNEFNSQIQAFLQKHEASRAAQLQDPVTTVYRSLYPSSPHDAYVAAASDEMEICHARRLPIADAQSLQPKYRYLYTHTFHGGPNAALEAGHGVELAFVFGNFPQIPLFAPDDSELALSAAMQRYWTSFAIHGAPTKPGEYQWPKYDGSIDNAMVLDVDTQRVMNGVDTLGCDVWDTGALTPPVLTLPFSKATVALGSTLVLPVTAADQAGLNATPMPSVAWSISGGGSIDPASGAFTATSAGGPFSVTAQSLGATATAPVEVVAAMDVGLKARTADGIASIAARPAAESVSPLRIRQGGQRYGIMLVDPADASASRLRVRTSRGERALMLLSN